MVNLRQVRHLVDISKMFNEIKAACTPVGLRNERYRQKGEASSVSVNDIMLDAHFLFFYFPLSSVPLPVLSQVPQGRLKNRWCLLSRFGHVLLWDPHDCSPQGSSADGILQARILEWAAMPPPGDLPNPGIRLRSSALLADSLPFEPPGKPKNSGVGWPAPSPAGLPDPGIKPGSPSSQVDSLQAELPGKPLQKLYTSHLFAFGSMRNASVPGVYPYNTPPLTVLLTDQ